MLKPIDIVVLAGLLLRSPDQAWTQLELSQKLHLSQPSIHRSLKQLERSGLWRGGHPQLSSFRDLIVYGVRFVYPPEIGAPTRGLPTAHAGPGLSGLWSAGEPYVWPYEDGDTYGPALLPLHSSVPLVALSDRAFHELLALVDVFRVGRARERSLATDRLSKMLELSP